MCKSFFFLLFVIWTLYNMCILYVTFLCYLHSILKKYFSVVLSFYLCCFCFVVAAFICMFCIMYVCVCVHMHASDGWMNGVVM
jgi:hypothetical protein